MAKKKVQSEPSVVSRLPEVVHMPAAERYELGQARRQQTPRSAHAEWNPPPGRDPLALLIAVGIYGFMLTQRELPARDLTILTDDSPFPSTMRRRRPSTAA